MPGMKVLALASSPPQRDLRLRRRSAAASSTECCAALGPADSACGGGGGGCCGGGARGGSPAAALLRACLALKSMMVCIAYKTEQQKVSRVVQCYATAKYETRRETTYGTIFCGYYIYVSVSFFKAPFKQFLTCIFLASVAMTDGVEEEAPREKPPKPEDPPSPLGPPPPPPPPPSLSCR